MLIKLFFLYDDEQQELCDRFSCSYVRGNRELCCAYVSLVGKYVSLYIDTSWMKVEFFNIQTCILYKVISYFVNVFYKFLSIRPFYIYLSSLLNYPQNTCFFYTDLCIVFFALFFIHNCYLQLFHISSACGQLESE